MFTYTFRRDHEISIFPRHLCDPRGLKWFFWCRSIFIVNRESSYVSENSIISVTLLSPATEDEIPYLTPLERSGKIKSICCNSLGDIVTELIKVLHYVSGDHTV